MGRARKRNSVSKPYSWTTGKAKVRIPWRIHGTGIFTYIYHKNQPFMLVNKPVPWILWEIVIGTTLSYMLFYVIHKSWKPKNCQKRRDPDRDLLFDTPFHSLPQSWPSPQRALSIEFRSWSYSWQINLTPWNGDLKWWFSRGIPPKWPKHSGLGITLRIMGSQNCWGLEIPETCEKHIQTHLFRRVPRDS